MYYILTCTNSYDIPLYTDFYRQMGKDLKTNWQSLGSEQKEETVVFYYQ